ncbi:hypothetical protein [Kineothrix sp. MB12-C1]|uniref:hypothetical protein n=1 Tax=Kineothrix sp. MB12-C1 TaxID=3070215 RepID=UPI0027D2A7A4|nr:hypothetical protein [Kineothrix sp. MB12-C1]WMC94375.1 hypothetical protein RBB56_09030 [Kineothrix sp. MB12-C1]
MICLLNLSDKNVKTNEEFSKVLKKRIRIFYWLIALGAITLSVALCNEFFWRIGENSWLDGLYTGLGTGIIIIAVKKIMNYKKVLKDEGLLKKERLKTQDERNQIIAGKAMQSATFTVLLLSYAVLLIAGFFSRTIFYCFWWVVTIYCLAYLIFNKYYNRKI